MNQFRLNTLVHGSNARNLCITILISTSKNALSFLLFLMSCLQQNWRTVQNRFCLEVRGVWGKRRCRGQGEEMDKIMYAHVNK
jgi:hypothetical protein